MIPGAVALGISVVFGVSSIASSAQEYGITLKTLYSKCPTSSVRSSSTRLTCLVALDELRDKFLASKANRNEIMLHRDCFIGALSQIQNFFCNFLPIPYAGGGFIPSYTEFYGTLFTNVHVFVYLQGHSQYYVFYNTQDSQVREQVKDLVVNTLRNGGWQSGTESAKLQDNPFYENIHNCAKTTAPSALTPALIPTLTPARVQLQEGDCEAWYALHAEERRLKKENKCELYKTRTCKHALYDGRACRSQIILLNRPNSLALEIRPKDAIFYADVRGLKWGVGDHSLLSDKTTLTSDSEYVVLFNVDGNLAMLEKSTRNPITPVILYRMVRDFNKINTTNLSSCVFHVFSNYNLDAVFTICYGGLRLS